MVTIIVPVFNDPAGIQSTTESIAQQVPEGSTFTIVDNGSSDETPAVVSRLSESYDRVKVEYEGEIQSSYAARNRGIRTSSSDVLAFVDANMTVSENWLQDALDEMGRNGADYMGCRVSLLPNRSSSVPAKYDAHTGFPVKQYMEKQHFAPTCCLFVRREVFKEVGLFDHRLISGGDKEFGNRVYEAGYDMHFAENVKMCHPVRDSIIALAKKDFRVGRGLCQLQRYHPDRYGEPGIPPRPSGVKSPNHDLPTIDRVAFGALSKTMTGIRGLGYFREYVEYLRSSDDE